MIDKVCKVNETRNPVDLGNLVYLGSPENLYYQHYLGTLEHPDYLDLLYILFLIFIFLTNDVIIKLFH